MPTEITPAEAQLWLAGLKKEVPCPNMAIKHTNSVGGYDHWCRTCEGTSVVKVPVLEGLRNPCPNPYCIAVLPEFVDSNNMAVCRICGGRNWLPNSTRQAIQDAMNKAEWATEISVTVFGQRSVRFWRHHSKFMDTVYHGKADDDHIAAMKAMKAAGYE